MKSKVPHKEKELEGRDVRIRFSSSVTEAFKILSTQAAKSPFFDPEIAEILTAWGSGEKTTLHDVLIALPLISEQMSEHVKATGDEHMKDAWRELCMQMPEKGFVVSQLSQRAR